MGGITGVAVLAPESPFCCDVQLNYIHSKKKLVNLTEILVTVVAN